MLTILCLYKFALKVLFLRWKTQELSGASPLDPHWTPLGPFIIGLPGPHAARLARVALFDFLFLINGAPNHLLPTGTLKQSYATANRAQQDQPYSNESLEIQTHNHLLKDNSRQSEVVCGYYGNRKKILRFLWNFGMSADITLEGHRLGKLRKLIPKFTPPEGRGHTLTYETLTYQYQLLCKFC